MDLERLARPEVQAEPGMTLNRRKSPLVLRTVRLELCIGSLMLDVHLVCSREKRVANTFLLIKTHAHSDGSDMKSSGDNFQRLQQLLGNLRSYLLYLTTAARSPFKTRRSRLRSSV